MSRHGAQPPDDAGLGDDNAGLGDDDEDEDEDEERSGFGSQRDLPDDIGDLGWDSDDETGWGEETTRWPMTWRSLYPRERWLWFAHLWRDVCSLCERYHLAIRSGWWEDDVQLEALAALAAWVDRYDSGEWDDPPGKLALLFELERIGGMLRDGLEPFHPDRDHPAFLSHIVGLGCEPPPSQ